MLIAKHEGSTNLLYQNGLLSTKEYAYLLYKQFLDYTTLKLFICRVAKVDYHSVTQAKVLEAIVVGYV